MKHDAKDMVLIGRGCCTQQKQRMDLPMIKALMGKGVDIHATDQDERTALHVAIAQWGHRSSYECVRALLRAGAHVNAKNTQRDTVLHLHILDDADWRALNKKGYTAEQLFFQEVMKLK